jgi:hypothetical protein
MSKVPEFTQQATCATDENPNAWFPEEDNPYSEEALRARNVCIACPAYDECLDYSLQFSDLAGIWANHDPMERREEQRYRKIDRDYLLPVLSLLTREPKGTQ